MLKEQIIAIEKCETTVECPIDYEGDDPCPECRTKQLLNLFKAEVNKLPVMADAEVKVILEKGFGINFEPESQEHIQRIIQLQDTKKQIFDLMGE